MQVNDFMVKKKELDAHVQFLKEQLLLVESRKERERLCSVLDELLAEKMQIDDYLEEASLEQDVKAVPYIDTVKQTQPVIEVRGEKTWGESLFAAKKTSSSSGSSIDQGEIVNEKKMGSLSAGCQEKDCPEIRNVQVAKLCEIEKGKVVKLCVSSYCISLGYRWCIYYGKNKGGRYVFSEADRTIKKIDSSWGESLCLYMDKTEFWKDRTVIIKDEMEEEKTTRFYKAPPPPI
nr:hypothetical protein Cduv_428 [Cedratvirus duvanny]